MDGDPVPPGFMSPANRMASIIPPQAKIRYRTVGRKFQLFRQLDQVVSRHIIWGRLIRIQPSIFSQV
jgi:hypothetical protein